MISPELWISKGNPKILRAGLHEGAFWHSTRGGNLKIFPVFRFDTVASVVFTIREWPPSQQKDSIASSVSGIHCTRDSIMGSLRELWNSENQQGRLRLKRAKSLATTTPRLRSFITIIFALLFLRVEVDATRKSHFGFAPKTRLTWVNGIGYNSSHMEKEAPIISQYFGGKKVEFYHNPTQMVDEQDTRGYFSDLTQAGQQKYLGRITEEVNGLVKHLKEAVRSVEGKRGGTVVHIAHSQGALVTWLAAKQLTPLEMNHIEVICFGGATPVRSTPGTPFRRCVNYYSVNDPLLFVNPSAETALRSGFIRYQSNYNTNEMEDEFCFLAPRVGDPIADHMLLGPTYASALEWEGRRFERRYQSYMERIVRHTLLTSMAIVQTILQLFIVVCQAFKNLVLKWKTFRRSVVRVCALAIVAIGSWTVAFTKALLARIIAAISGLIAQTAKSSPATTEGSMLGSPAETPLPPIDSSNVSSDEKISGEKRAASLLRFIRLTPTKGSVLESPPENSAFVDSTTVVTPEEEALGMKKTTSLLRFLRRAPVTDSAL